MFDCSLSDSFGYLLCPFWSIALKCGARLPIRTLKQLDRVDNGGSFLAGGI